MLPCTEMLRVTMHRQLSFSFNSCSGTPGDFSELRNSVDRRLVNLVSFEHSRVTLNRETSAPCSIFKILWLRASTIRLVPVMMALWLHSSTLSMSGSTKLMASFSSVVTAIGSSFTRPVDVIVQCIDGRVPSPMRSTKLEYAMSPASL